MLETHLVIGEILKPQGVHGQVKVRPITYDPTRFEALQTVFFQDGHGYVAHKVQTDRMDMDAVYMSFDGVDDRDAAEKLRGQLIYIDREHAVQLPEEAEFICDLIGCEGLDDTGKSLGRLTEVLQPGGNDVYVFHGLQGEVLVPALKSVVLEVDVQGKRMLLDAKRLSEVAVFNEN